MTDDIRPAMRIGRTQWAKWGPEARAAFNRVALLGFTLETAIAEGNAVQARVRKERLREEAPQDEAPQDEAPQGEAPQDEAPPKRRSRTRVRKGRD